MDSGYGRKGGKDSWTMQQMMMMKGGGLPMLENPMSGSSKGGGSWYPVDFSGKGAWGGYDGGKGYGKSKGKSKNKGKGKSSGPPREIAWKLRLSNAYQEIYRRCPSKEAIVYTTTHDEEANTWSSTISGGDFKADHECVGVHPSKKEAEESVAKVCLEGEYPDIFERIGNEEPKKAKKRSFESDYTGGFGGGGEWARSGRAKDDLPYKSRLAQAYMKEHHICPTKETIVYEFTEQEDGYIASISCDKFAGKYESEEPKVSRKAAEEAVAQIALEAEFPNFGLDLPAPRPRGEDGPDRKSRRTEEDSERPRKTPADLDPKSRLNEGMMIVLGRSINKGDAEYTIKQEDGLTVATVLLNCLDVPQSFTGEGVSGGDLKAKKEAQNNAALVALATFEDLIEEKRPEHEAKKAEKLAELHRKRDEKRAEKAEKAPAAEPEAPATLGGT